VAQGKLTDHTGHLLDRYRLPRPRLGLAIAGIASAGMDISDGLVQDLGHLCRAPAPGDDRGALCAAVRCRRAAGPDWLAACLTGGDDYELLLAVPPVREAALQQAARAVGIKVTRIGTFAPGAPPSWSMTRMATDQAGADRLSHF